MENIQRLIEALEDYTHSYQAKLLLTRNEWYEYKKLKKITDERNLHICPKVRLLDIVEPKNGKGYMGALGKIKSKHFQFLSSHKISPSNHRKRFRKQRTETKNVTF